MSDQQFPATVTVTGLAEAVSALLLALTKDDVRATVKEVVEELDLSAAAVSERARETSEEVLDEHTMSMEHLDRDEVAGIAEERVEEYLSNNCSFVDEDTARSIASEVFHEEMCAVIKAVTDYLESN
jgi:DNA-binding Lrp family transcriptional regulator